MSVLSIVSELLSILSILFMFLFISLDWKVVLSIVFLFLYIGISSVSLFLKDDVSFLVFTICPVFLSLALGFILYASIYDFVDFLQGITMFGNPSFVPFDFTILLLILCSMLISFFILFLNCHHEK
jgi:hypothetical protein